MKCTIPEISWHNREPVLSVDIFPENRNFYRLASGGGDCHVLIWQMNITKIGAVTLEVISDLTRHQRAVNCVRWSNSGQYLASGDDDANIIIWQLKTDNIPLLEGDTGDKETWIIYKIMRGHKEDVYDLCWSIDDVKILSGSVDNTAILWDVNKGKMDHILTDHKGFVQGVSWDPKNQIIATISTDRICRIFDPFGKQIKARIHKGKLQVPDTHYLHDKEVKFFHDDTFKSFFRRLQFSPDGSLLIVPSGHIEADSSKDILYATLMFTLDNFSSPAVILPLPHQSSTVVRCCPILFQLHKDGPDPMINLPYRMIFAVGTDHDIILYDTQQPVPFARFQDIHYTRLTDLTWSYDGLLLIASSTDGFCSLITFEIDELGILWEKMESEEEKNLLNISGCEELFKDENMDTNNKEITVEENINKVNDELKEEGKKRPSFLEQWALQKPKKKRLDVEENKPVNEREKATEIIQILDSPEKNPIKAYSCEKTDPESTKEKKKDTFVNKLIPRRITAEKKEITTKKIPEIISSDKKITSKPEEKVNILVPRRNTGKTEEKINILVPRRIEKKHIDPTPGTSKVEANRPTEKLNKLKTRKNKDINIVQNKAANEGSSSESEAETLSKEELEELHKASENIKEFFCRVPEKQNSHSDVRPIAVRRKPVENQSTGNFEKENVSKQDDTTVSTVNNYSDAKVIEVRRKPRDQGILQLKSEEKPAKKHSGAKHFSVKSKEEVNEKKCNSTNLEAVIKLPENCLDSQHNTVKTEHKGGSTKKHTSITVEDKSVDCNKASISKKGDNKKKKITDSLKETEFTSSSPDVVCIDSDNEEDNKTPKKSKSDQSKPSKKVLKEAAPKIKVSSLVKTRKTPETTPKKTNALLNFLQKSAEKAKKKNEAEIRIDISLEENDARDAWKCESKRLDNDDAKQDKDASRALPEDDVTEDFCLQLEESQDPYDEKTESRSAEKYQTKTRQSNEIKNTQCSKNISEEKTLQKEGNCKSNMPKTPRRVPLITVASPKGKTKKE